MLEYLNMVGTGAFVIFFFGFCVFIHELGHFLAAKWRGLHVIAFSIGFKKIWGYKYKGVDYRIGCLPFGGYVDLPQIDSTGDAEDENGKILPRVKPFDRIIVAVAGPLFNVLFGLFLGLFIWFYGIPEDSPRMNKMVISSVEKQSPEYKAGLRKDDIVTKINGNNFYCSWGKVIREILFTVGDVNLTIKRAGKEFDIKYTPRENPNFMGKEGLAFPFFRIKVPNILYPKAGSPAEQAGIKGGDKLIAVNGFTLEEKGNDWGASQLFPYNNNPLNLTVEREGKLIEIKNLIPKQMTEKRNIIGIHFMPEKVMKVSEDIGELKKDDIISMNIDGSDISSYYILKQELSTNKRVVVNIKRKGKILNKNFDLYYFENKNAFSIPVTLANDENSIKILSVVSNSIAEAAGLKRDDRILQINDKIVKTSEVSAAIVNAKGSLKFKVLRDNKEIVINLKPEALAAHGIGLEMSYINHPTPVQQLKDVVRMSYLSLRGIFAGLGKKMGITQNGSSLKPRHLSGPLGIVDTIGTVVYRGSYLLGINFIVMITFSLGILNLLPIPVLDGGHITIASLEMIFRRRLHKKTIEVISVICITFLLAFMAFVTFHDSLRFVTKHFGDDNVITLHLSQK